MTSHPLPGRTAAPAGIPAEAKARFWNRVARRYAADPISDLPGYEHTLQRVRSLLSPSHSVLEIGCGTGTTALRLAAHSRQWLATDVSPEMIAIARERLVAQPVSQLRFGLADAEAAAPAGAQYDRLMAFNVLHLLSDLDGAIAALLPMLAPGGLLISKTPCLAEMNPLVPRLLVPVMRALGQAPPVLSFDAAQLRSAFERQGLEVVAFERHGTKRKDFRVFIVARKP